MRCRKRSFLISVFVLIVLEFLFGVAAVATEESPAVIEQIFQKAKKDYLATNIQSAAEQIKSGAAYMKKKAATASAKGKEKLEESARELDRLSDDVKSGAVKSVKTIENAFARAYYALARESHIESTEFWLKREKLRAGEALEAANRHLEKAMAWAGQKAEESTKKVMRETADMAQNLKKKTRGFTQEASRAIENAGKEIEKFGRELSSEANQ